MIVFTNGCFDILHAGHVLLLRECRRLAGENGTVIVGLNSDASVKRLKGESRPINDERARKFILESLIYVDGVLIFDDDTPERVLVWLRPDIIVKGGDYAVNDIVGKQYTKEVVIFPYVDGFSTTAILEAAKASASHR